MVCSFQISASSLRRILSCYHYTFLFIVLFLFLYPFNTYAESGYFAPDVFSFIQPHLDDPEFTVNETCAGQPTLFTIVNIQGIDSVYWNFKDEANFPNDTSTYLSPAYTFSGPGTYYPELTVYSGLLHTTAKDTVVIHSLPNPQLGSDTIFCGGAYIALTLDAGPGDVYNWNGNLIQGSQTLAISDTGTYFVRVQQQGCAGYDTIYVGEYLIPTADVSDALFTNANCNQADGSITGIVFEGSEPFRISWHNESGRLMGSGHNLINAPAGSYHVLLRYGTNCFYIFGPYNIRNNNAPQITEILIIHDDLCLQNSGSIQITIEPGPGEPFLYSIDNGSTWHNNEGLFTNLSVGLYNVKVKDIDGCEAICNSNPVFIAYIIHVVFFNTIITPENGTNGDGSITVIASGENLTYQLDDYPPQIENVFSGLSAGNYAVSVTDYTGCTSTQTVIISNTLGLPENEKLQLIVAPVPASDFVRIESPVNILKCDLINTSGKTLLSLNTHGKSAKIDISTLRNGFYLLRIHTAEGIAVRKIVKS